MIGLDVRHDNGDTNKPGGTFLMIKSNSKEYCP